MAFSAPFRALLKLTGLWALPWTALGLVVAAVRWAISPDLRTTAGSLSSWLLTHALAYGTLGLISGLYLGLLLAWLTHGRRWQGVPTRRVAGWSALAGAAPPALFGALGLIFGTPATVYLPLVGLGLVSAAASSFLATSTHLAATRRALADPASTERLP
jgi:hypothetical protein